MEREAGKMKKDEKGELSQNSVGGAVCTALIPAGTRPAAPTGTAAVFPASESSCGAMWGIAVLGHS